MADLLRQGTHWLAAQRHRHLSSVVTYQRGAVSLQIPATVGKTIFELEDQGGGILRVESRDYLIAAADLSLGRPQRGDRILDDGRVYELSDFGQEPCWRYSDPYGTVLRLHTRQVMEGA